jgi:hypothetical protein
MNNEVAVNPTGSVAVRSVRMRLSSLVVAALLVFSALLLTQHRAEAAPAKPAAVSAQVISFPGFDIRALVCPILITIRNSFASTPFFSFASPILNNIISAFGCGPSGG